jgi:hypothetical protein
VFEKRRLKKHGTKGKATVVDAQQHPKITTNDYRKYDFIVDVHPEDAPAFRAEVQETFTVGGLKPQAGDVVSVRYDLESRAVMFDLEGDPRYDLKALRAEQEASREQLLREPPAES